MNLRNSTYTGSMGRQSLFDLEVPSNWNQTLIIFVHGFMGFKDWGAWNLIQKYFVSHGFGFAKINLTHNGGTVTNGIDFPDENAFADNTYTKEIADIGFFREHIKELIQPKKTYLIGHSRGGGAIILHSIKQKVDKIALWASISDIGSRFPSEEALQQWEVAGSRTILNSRTKQYLRQNILLYEDYKSHESQLDIQSAIIQLDIPKLVVHGDKDTSVSIEEGKDLAKWGSCDLKVIQDADHVFGSSHPWLSEALPKGLQEVCELTKEFFNNNSSFSIKKN